MPSHWSRRTLLASLSTAALAGCVGDDPTRSATPTGQSSSAPNTPQGTPDPPDSLDSAWPVPGAESGRSNYAAGVAGPTEPVAELWTTELNGSLTDPVVASETLYVGAGEVLHALNARTGDERWTRSLSGTTETPWVVGESVYVPTSEAVVALATDDGAEQWQADLPSKADGGFFATDHGVYALTEGDEPAAVALDHSDGGERWRTPLTRGPSAAHLFASDDSVFVSSGGSGSTPWRLTADTGDIVGEKPGIATDSPNPRFYRDETVFSRDFLPAAVDARPAPGTDSGSQWREHIWVTGLGPLSAGADHLYCVAPGDSVEPRGDGPDDSPGLYALGLTDGSRAWSTTDIDAATAGRPVVTDAAVIVPTADTLHCFDPADGTQRWTVPGDDIDETVIVVEDLVYATDGETVRAFRPP
ncbi:PQQ-binding-like beta-propeller repeat protein [Halomicroarcula sp. F28]|uniref:outer membrane protein assembly factor BamB family protein n=1 Tax=Haloarcula salinisoli TaxID=2487746 RepID=UPI001C7329AE|nr:PQQ-binding-like beta-propeller repeat protein [Halomicroarcula salinisoli]MBX0286712.1 PQQ-binding-like beta-propeller repeat protein [Halomicroarcula salinisoli]